MAEVVTTEDAFPGLEGNRYEYVCSICDGNAQILWQSDTPMPSEKTCRTCRDQTHQVRPPLGGHFYADGPLIGTCNVCDAANVDDRDKCPKLQARVAAAIAAGKVML